MRTITTIIISLMTMAIQAQNVLTKATNGYIGNTGGQSPCEHCFCRFIIMQRIISYILSFVLLSIPTCVTAQVGVDEFSVEMKNTLLSYKTNKQVNRFLKTAMKQVDAIEKAKVKIPIYSVYINKKYNGNHNNADSLFVYLNPHKAYLTSVFVSSGKKHMVIDEKYRNRQEQFVDSTDWAVSMGKIIKDSEADYVVVVDRDINNCIMVGRNNVFFYHYDLQKGYIKCAPSYFIKEFDDGKITFQNYRPSPLNYAR